MPIEDHVHLFSLDNLPHRTAKWKATYLLSNTGVTPGKDECPCINALCIETHNFIYKLLAWLSSERCDNLLAPSAGWLIVDEII